MDQTHHLLPLSSLGFHWRQPNAAHPSFTSLTLVGDDLSEEVVRAIKNLMMDMSEHCNCVPPVPPFAIEAHEPVVRSLYQENVKAKMYR